MVSRSPGVMETQEGALTVQSQEWALQVVGEQL